MLTTYNWTIVPIHNTSLSAQHFKDDVTCSRPNLPDDSFLAENSGRPYKVLPMLALTCLVLDPSLQVSPSVRQNLRCGTFWALFSGCSTLPSSADTWPFFEKLDLWLHPNNPVQLQLVIIAVFTKKFCPWANSTGKTASVPYVRLKGVSPIGVFAAVL